MCLTAGIRVVLILLIKRRPAAAASSENRVVFNDLHGILIKSESFQYTVLLKVNVLQPGFNVSG
ncbi:hypothetical protein D3C85_1841770 [compost metagenome]